MNAAEKKLNAFDEQALKQMQDDIRKLQNELMKLREEMNDKFNNVQEQLNRKADKQDLHLLEAKLLEKLNEML